MGSVVLALLLAAAADDREPPSIVHTPVRSAEHGRELKFEAEIYDKSGVFEPLLYWRPKGTEKWRTVPLKPMGNDLFVTALASFDVTAPLEYFIEAYDAAGNGPVRFGSSERPLLCEIKGATPAAPAQASAAEAPPPPETQNVPVSPLAPGPAVAPAEKQNVPVSGSLPWGPIATAGGGLALLAVGALLWSGAENEASGLRTIYTGGKPMKPADHERALAAASTSRIASGLMIAGLLAGGGGGVWLAISF